MIAGEAARVAPAVAEGVDEALAPSAASRSLHPWHFASSLSLYFVALLALLPAEATAVGERGRWREDSDAGDLGIGLDDAMAPYLSW